MPLDPQLAQQLKQVFAYSNSAATVNVYGEISVAATAATAYCRMEPRTREVEDVNGTFAKTTHMLIVNSTIATPTFDTRVWLPGTSPSSSTYARRIKLLHPCTDEYGKLSHYEIFV